MRTVVTIVACLAVFSISAQQNKVLPANEFTLNGFGGLSTLKYGTYDLLKVENGYGGGGGVGYNYFFSDHFGLSTGLEAALYNAKATASSLTSGQIMSGDEYSDFSQLVANGTYRNFAESQKMWALQVPVMLQVLAPLSASATSHFYAALGGRVGFSLSDSYKQTATNYSIANISEYDILNGYTPEGRSLGALNKSGSLSFSSPNLMASAELGFRWKLSDNAALYTAVYADYGLTDIIPAQKGRAALMVPLIDEYGSIWESETFNHNSIMTAHRPDYGTVTNRETVDFIQINDRYVDKVNTLALGLKIKIAFGKAPRKIVPVPEPTPRPEPTPTPPVVQTPKKDTVIVVPTEIKQAMIDLSNTLFEFDKFNLNAEAVQNLQKIIKWLNENPSINAVIEGHTDNYGTDEYNQTLSENRAKSVRDYLVEHGVDGRRLSSVGYGESRPIATNSTDEGRRQNRRVELKIVK